MRTHTNDFKNGLTSFGRQFDYKITYNSQTLPMEDIKSVSYILRGNLLKTSMKELKIDSSVLIARGTTINYQIGLNINDSYEYLDMGNYIVEKIEEQKDTRSYLLTCYDKMLLTMVDYADLNISYPITIRSYIDAICSQLGITFANASDTFINYDKEILNELYLDNEGNSLGYTYRDVLDEIAQVTGSFIVINEDDELEIKYINTTNDTIDENYFNNTNVNIEKKYGPINSLVFSRSADSDNIIRTDDASISINGLCELKIVDNQILNGNNRSDFADDLFTYLNGIYYYLNDFDTRGIIYYELGDLYNVSIFGNTYQCLLLNDEIDNSASLKESIYTEETDVSQTDYKASDTTDKKINQAYLIVNKQEGTITGLVSKTNSLDTTINNNYQELNSKFDGYTPMSTTVELQNSVTTLQTDTYTKTEIDTKLVDGSVEKVMTTSGTFDIDGMHYEKTNANTSTTINEVGVGINKTDGSDDYILFAGYVDENNSQYSDFKGQTIVASENMLVKNYFVVGNNSRMEDYENGTGMFYIGG